MGLDAVVFRNVRVLESEFGHGVFDVDDITGEAVVKPGAGVRVAANVRRAAAERLGNVFRIAQLREWIGTILVASNSLIMDRVLYSGSHCGDSIGLDEFGQLRTE